MMNRDRRRGRRLGLMAGATALAFVLGVAGSASAGIGEGDMAPDFEGKEFYNCEPVSLAKLRGRIVLYELFSTG